MSTVTDAVFLGFLGHTVSTKRPVRTPDGFGGETLTYNPHLSALECHVQPLPIAQRQLAKLRLWCQFGEDIQDQDEVTHNGTTYLVNFVGDEAGQGHHYVVDLEESPGQTV